MAPSDIKTEFLKQSVANFNGEMIRYKSKRPIYLNHFCRNQFQRYFLKIDHAEKISPVVVAALCQPLRYTPFVLVSKVELE